MKQGGGGNLKALVYVPPKGSFTKSVLLGCVGIFLLALPFLFVLVPDSAVDTLSKSARNVALETAKAGVHESDEDTLFMASKVVEFYNGTIGGVLREQLEGNLGEWPKSKNAKILFFGLSSSHLFKSKFSKEEVYSEIISLRDPLEGGFRMNEQAPATLSATYFCIESLKILGMMKEFDKESSNVESLVRFILSLQHPSGGFSDSTPFPNATSDLSTLASFRAAIILAEYVNPSYEISSNVSSSLTKIPRYLHAVQGPDGGFHASPASVSFEYFRKASPCSSTAQGLFVADSVIKLGLVGIWGSDLSFGPYSWAKSYLSACVSLHPFGQQAILSSAPWGNADVESAYYFMLYDKSFSFTFTVPACFKHFLAGIGALLLVVSVLVWFKPKIQHYEAFPIFIQKSKVIFAFLSVCGFLLFAYSRIALPAYIIFWVYLTLEAFNILQEDKDGLISMVASVNILGNLCLVMGFQMVLPYVYAQSIIFYVLLLWGVMCTALVTFVSGYFVGHKSNNFYTTASFLSWVVSVPVGTVVIIFCGNPLDVYRLLTVRGEFFNVLIVLPFISFCLSQGVALASRLMFDDGSLSLKEKLQRRIEKIHKVGGVRKKAH